jgi:AcrR family transcriptional regulator
MILDMLFGNSTDEASAVSAIGQIEQNVRKHRAAEAGAPIDRRAARSRRAMHDALMSLILRKGYEAVTVQDIVDEADVGRSTFYSHYTGKEDLFRSGFAMLRRELAEAAQLAARQAGDSRRPLPFSLSMFEHAGRYRDTFRVLVGGRGGQLAIAEIRKILLDMVRAGMPSSIAGDLVPREARVQFVVDTIMGVLTWWFAAAANLAT